VIRKVQKMVPPYVTAARASVQGRARARWLAHARPGGVGGADVAFLQYTGGTTGVSKGAVLTHRNMVANTLQSVAFLPELTQYQNPAVITALPLYHIFALTTNMLAVHARRRQQRPDHEPARHAGFVEGALEGQFTFITGVNTLFNALLNTPGFDKLDFSSLKVALGGGMAVQAAVSERWRKAPAATSARAAG
jgi:long-chain acyl-CoA synthetase